MDKGTVVLIVADTLFILLTIVFILGKGTFILNGLKFRSEEDLKRFNPKKMMKFLGKCMIGIDVAVSLMIISNITEYEIFAIIAALIILFVCIGATIYMKIKQRFLD